MSDYATQVEARFAADGGITLRRFAWQRRQYVVTSQGRQWDAADGRHLLVMTAGERVFELVYEEEAGLWRVARAPEERRAA
jgi:hypothetical protein